MNGQITITKRTLLITIGLIILTGLLLFMAWPASKPNNNQGTTYTSEPTVQTLEKLAHLVTLKVHIADVLEAESKDGWKSVKGAWLIKGDALLGIDMTKATIASINYTNKHAIILLSAPEVMSPRVDHEKTKTYNVKSGKFTPAEFESTVRDNAMREAQRLVDFAARDEANIRQARECCEKLLTGFYSLAEWNVEVRWIDLTNAMSRIDPRSSAEP